MGPAVRARDQILGVAGEVLAVALASSENYRSDDETLWRDVGGQVHDLPMGNEECKWCSRFSKLD